MADYELNEPIVLTGTFTVGGVATDPTTVTLRIIKPDRTIITKETADLTKSSTGIYTYTQTGDLHGLWHYRFEGTGTAAAIDEGSFLVKKSYIVDD